MLEMMGYSSFMGWFSFFGWIFMLLFWGFIIWGIVSLIKWGSSQQNGNSHGHGENNAMNILKERYAKGEISKKEFEEKRKEILK